MINVYEQLADCSRRRILGELRSGPKRVSDLVESLKLKQPNVSNHLAKLREKQIVTAEKSGREVFYRFATPGIRAIIDAALSAPMSNGGCGNLDKLAQTLSEAALDGEDQAALDVVNRLLFSAVPPLDIYECVISRAMQIVGELYVAGEIDVGKEHLATETIQRILTRIALSNCPSNQLGLRALLGCGPNSFHTLGLRIVGDYLRSRGWSTRFLGANVPNEAFCRAVEDYDPAVVLVSCCSEETTLPTIRLLRDLSNLKSKQDFALGVGGHIASNEAGEFISAGADFVTQSLTEFTLVHLPKIEKPEQTQGSAPAQIG
jgi:methanogenic corrinoid protein MtbC1